MSKPPPPAETLLEHTGWLKGLALRLVRDEAAADDIVQQALLQALRKPPRDRRALPAWLGRVARNEARQIGRSEDARTRREVSAARTGNAPATADVVARAEIHRLVVDAVLALDEPFRTIVLLRYFDGLRPKEIAAHLGMSSNTVRSRLKRGLDRLRQTLDDRSESDRRSWALALVALVDAPARAWGLTWAAVVAVALLVVGGWVVVRGSGDETAGTKTTVSKASEGPRLAGRPAEEQATQPEPASVAGVAEAPSEPVPMDLCLHLLRPHREPEEIGIRYVGLENVQPWKAVRAEHGGLPVRAGEKIGIVPVNGHQIHEWLCVTVPDPVPMVLDVSVLAFDDPRYREMVIEIVDDATGKPVRDAVFEWPGASSSQPTLQADAHGRVHLRAAPHTGDFPAAWILTNAGFSVHAPGYDAFPRPPEPDWPYFDATALDRWLATGVHRVSLCRSAPSTAEREVLLLDADGLPLPRAEIHVVVPGPPGFRNTDERGFVKVPAEASIELEFHVRDVCVQAWTLEASESPLEIHAPPLTHATLVVEDFPGWRSGTWRCVVCEACRSGPACGTLALGRATIRLPLVVGREVTFRLKGETAERTWKVTPDRRGTWEATARWPDLPVVEKD